MPTIDLDLSLTKQQSEIFDYQGPARFHVIKKGRRFGFTYGAAIKSIEWCLDKQGPVLWGDTVHGNLTRYVEDLYLPRLRGIPHRWRQQEKILEIAGQRIDFRSAEHPENWEGFKYRKIVLNEAGLILQNPYLYTNAVLPMMMDYPDAELYAGGVPKGKTLKDGTDHPFFTLHRLAESGSTLHRSLTFTSYDNPFLSQQDVKQLEAEIATMSPGEERQEIHGEFIDAATGQLFSHKFDRSRHVRECKQIPTQPVYCSLDFNVEPFCGIFAHIWEDRDGPHCWIFREESINNPSVDEMAQRIRSIAPHVLLLNITGDYNGSVRRLGEKSTASLFDDLSRNLGLHSRQVELLPNPPHLKSREDSNYVFVHHPDYRIDPSCTGLIKDNLTVEVKPTGEINKGDRSKGHQRSDLLDCQRYLKHVYLRRWLTEHRRGMR